MAFRKKKEPLSVEPGLAAIVQESNEETIIAETTTPFELYNQHRKTSKGKFIRSFLCLLLVEGLILCGFGYGIYQNGIHKRLSRELEMQLGGEISLATGTYSGDTDFGYFDGLGDYSFRSGSTYSGEWDENEFYGAGILKSPTEGTYDGEFKDSKKDGQGTFLWLDGTTYEGSWKNDMMAGEGVYKGPNSLVYSGVFKDNQFESGTCTFENQTGDYQLTYDNGSIIEAVIMFHDNTKYTGQCGITALEGEGTLSFSDGDSFTGGFDDGKRNGSGKYSWKSGDKYDGGWENDTMTGSGTYTFSNGNKMQGTFSGNSFISGTYEAKNSFGSYVFKIADGTPTSATITLSDGTKYEGGMKDGSLSGSAQITYSNGDTYSGTVSNGQKSGSGLYKWKNGASYDGSWKNDKMDGRGTYRYPTGQTGFQLVGDFVGGLPNGSCKYYVSSSESYDTEWSNGTCTKVIE